MPVKFVRGDMFQTPKLKSFAHGCNCAGAMGKGVAVEFRNNWPNMYSSYKERCKSGLFNPGDVFTWVEGENTIFNLGTQKTWRTKATLDAVATSLGSMLAIAQAKGIKCIGIPRIGAGLGGLVWDDVKAIIQEEAQKSDVTLIVFEEFVSGLDASLSID